MKSQSSTAANPVAAPLAADGRVVKMLGAAAFVLLAAASCSRALLNEDRTIPIKQLLRPSEVRLVSTQSATLMVRHVVHLVVAGGIGLGALWIVLSRRRWRFGALEAGALALTCGALLSVPVASDKRLAMNMAIDMILPLIAAAALYHLLAQRVAWRRALLAGLVAVAAANCWKATAQHYWEYTEGWYTYQRSKGESWSQLGVSMDEPSISAWMAVRNKARPRGFIQGINVFSSFLLLGLAATGAALAGRGWQRARVRPIERGSDKEPATKTSQAYLAGPAAAETRSTQVDARGGAPGLRTSKPIIVATAGLVVLAAWLMAMLLRIHTAGAIVGLIMALAVVAAVRLRVRPKRLAILLAGGLVLLQTALVVLAMSSPDLHRALLDYRGAGDKVRTLGARLCYWEGAIRLFASNPFTGVGPSQFSKHYLAVRPPYADEDAVDVHSWLLNMATEWGVLGALGVAIAVAGSGWCILRSMARPPDEAPGPAEAALVPAVLVVLGCWLLVAYDLPWSQWVEVLAYPTAISLVAAVLVSLCGLHGRGGQVILLAGLVGFFVHCTVEPSASVVGVMWPFWAIVALAMAWNGPEPATSAGQASARRRMVQAGPILAGAAVVVVVGLTVRPMRAVGLMHQAQRAIAQNRLEPAVELLRSAAAADPLDPLPLRTAVLLRYRLGQEDPARALEHFREYAALSHAAVQRNPLDFGFWRSLALANMFLATETNDFALVDEAVQDMRRALELNPQWVRGWLELLPMAAVTDAKGGDRPALLRTALEAIDKALALEDGRPKEMPRTLTSQDRAELQRTRKQLLRRLEAATARPAAAPLSR